MLSTSHISEIGQAALFLAIQAYFTAIPSRSTPSLFYDVALHLHARQLRAEPCQLHLFGADAMQARAFESP